MTENMFTGTLSIKPNQKSITRPQSLPRHLWYMTERLLKTTLNPNNTHVFFWFQGQLCDYCDPSNPEQNHSIAHAIDGTERWWQSPPLSRGEEFNEVDIVINLEQVSFFLIYSRTDKVRNRWHVITITWLCDILWFFKAVKVIISIWKIVIFFLNFLFLLKM